MKIVIATDSFKGSLSSEKSGEIFKRVASRISPDIDICAVEIADGGEGTLDAVVRSGRFSVVNTSCSNPFFDLIPAKYGISGKVAFVEMAQASGLTLIPYADGNALDASTIGTGELILDALENGAEEIIVSVGGSATNDGGVGALAALGYRFLDKNGKIIYPVGKELTEIHSVDGSFAVDTSKVKFTVLTDVDNPLLGELGATRFYGKQKGAFGANADLLESGMQNFADITEKYTGVRLHDMKGAGAAGGLAGGLVAYLGAELKSGIETVLELIDFDERLRGASAVVTGEGRIDDQSVHGKAVSGVCGRAKRLGVPVYAMAGCSEISPAGMDKLGIVDVETLVSVAKSPADSIENAEKYAEIIAERILKKIYKGE